jgi:hypothetical protein
MPYEIMYEGDGFIRKGPEPKAIKNEERVAVPAEPVSKPEQKGGAFSFSRVFFGR